jgi:coenzyme F420 biosynthesis associated uncharacterized protein
MPDLDAAGANDYVDWELAKRTGRKIARGGPKLSWDEIAQVMEELRESAAQSHEQSPVLVVDRGTWIEVNVDSMSQLLAPVVDKITAKRKSGKLARRASATTSGAETGALLGFFSSKVLGQYDIAPSGKPSLLLVAPNIVQAERDLEADPTDFRRWVCLHEETHRVQFTANPWLREHLISRTRELMVELVPDADELPDRIRQAVRSIGEIGREGGGGITELFMGPEQREELAAITAIMSLLEGHADVVMDDVGPQVIPSVAQIREKFDSRRKGAGSVDRLLRRLLGMEAKMRQYRDGARFCRAVQDQVGVDGFNQVWESPQTLPSAAEITQPQLWLDRIHGA